MMIFPLQMTRVGPRRYLVRLETAHPSGMHEFEFSVVGEDIRVVESPPAFEELTGHHGGAVRDLFAAVMAFDRAQGAVVSQSPDER